MYTNNYLSERHSSFAPTAKNSNLEVSPWKSDIYLVPPKELTSLTGGYDIIHALSMNKNNHGEYHRKFEHDEIPVKETNVSKSVTSRGDEEPLEGTQDQLDPDLSLSSLESNIQFFKTTVQQIFDNFCSTMHDLELYKNKFQSILEKNKAESIMEMEDFIKDMIQHIMSSESFSNEKRNKPLENKCCGSQSESSQATSGMATATDTCLQSMVETYNNDSYLTDSIADDKSLPQGTQDTYNIFLLGSSPFVEIKMKQWNQLSEINIKDINKPSEIDIQNQIASAENIKKIAAKKKQLEKHVTQINVSQDVDREIPVKISAPKKNIHLDEDFKDDVQIKKEKSMLAKICNFFCKRFRMI